MSAPHHNADGNSDFNFPYQFEGNQVHMNQMQSVGRIPIAGPAAHFPAIAGPTFRAAALRGRNVWVQHLRLVPWNQSIRLQEASQT
jgi:hypothetical protein